MKRFIKKIINIVLFLITFFYKSDKKIPNNKLLIIKIDAIGDYILFRNFLKIIRESDLYRDYKITFLGNKVNKDIAEYLDKDYVDDFIWINKKELYKNPLLFSKLIQKIKGEFNTTIQATHSREYFGDLLVRASGSSKRIGFKGDCTNISKIEKKVTDKWYTELIDINENVNFEFYKNKSFFEQLLGHTIKINKPHISKKLENDFNITLPKNFVVLYPGSLIKSKQWPTKSFREIGLYIIEKYNLDIIICGSKSDNKIASEIKKNHSRILDLTGKTNLLDVIHITSRAKLTIANDTGGAHISAALGIPLVVLFRYNHYMRFFPYPKDISENIYCLFPNIFNNCDNQYLIDKFKNGSNIDISLISTDQVKKAIENFI